MKKVGRWFWSAFTAVAVVIAVICFSQGLLAQSPVSTGDSPTPAQDWRISLITQPSFVVAGQPTRLLFNWSVGASALPTVPLRVQIVFDGAPVYIGWLTPEPDLQELVVTFPQAGAYQVYAMSGVDQSSVVAHFPLTVATANIDDLSGDHLELWNVRNWMQQHRLWLLVGYIVVLLVAYAGVLGGIIWRSGQR